jgi:thiosulfate reductase/polysulfide reductase chain A
MFRKMEFVAVVDIVPSDSSMFADVILPESTYLERTDPVEEFNAPYPFAALRRQVVRPLHDTKPNIEIMTALARRLDLGQFFDYDIDGYIKTQLEPLGLTAGDFEKTGVWTNRTGRRYGNTRSAEYRFRTPSGRIELANERLRRNGLEPLPMYRAPASAPANALRLLVGKQAYFTHAANQDNPWLAELGRGNRLWIHRDAAAARGIGDGDTVAVRSPIGEVRLPAWVTDRIRPDCVHLPHGWGHRSPALTIAHNAGASDQDLIESKFDRISGNAALHETFVTVEKAS